MDRRLGGDAGGTTNLNSLKAYSVPYDVVFGSENDKTAGGLGCGIQVSC